jgi:hypothetical protein
MYDTRLRSVLSLRGRHPSGIPVHPNTSVSLRKLWINPKPNSSRFAIKTRGGTCYEAQWDQEESRPLGAWELAVKDQWRTSDRSAEGVFLAEPLPIELSKYI